MGKTVMMLWLFVRQTHVSVLGWLVISSQATLNSAAAGISFPGILRDGEQQGVKSDSGGCLASQA